MVDVARNFHSKGEILKLIEQMARYKLNKLHLHLADDEGWRLEVPALPELTQIGAYRCLDPSEKTCLSPQLGADPSPDAPTNGYFTRMDYLNILAAAKARQIEVIPSFDMPGHSRAAIRSMEVRYDRLMALGKRDEALRYRLVEPEDTTKYSSIQNYDDNTLNVCIDSTYRFLDTVIDAVAALHSEAGVPLKTYHIGADETAGAWVNSPACRAMTAKEHLTPPKLAAYFIERVSHNLAKRGIKVGGWSDGMGHTSEAAMPKAVQTNIWGGIHTGGIVEAHRQANRGWDIILSLPDVLYFDMPHAPMPDEPGYDWATDSFKVFAFLPENLPANASLIPDIMNAPATVNDSVPMEKGRRITGIQGQLWSETVRSDAQVNYKLFPRLAALAERAWRRASWETPYVPGASFTTGDGKVDLAAVTNDWKEFAGRMAIELGALDAAGVNYRLAPPGARIRNGMLEANTEFPGTIIEYRIGRDENAPWLRYTKPVTVSQPASLRTRTPDGRRVSNMVSVTAL
jgi:hexosaminidase